MTTVLVRGDGVAAHCCASLLKRAGFRTGVEHAARPRVPAIMLSDAALALIHDVFGQRPPFSRFHRIDRRVVAWGRAESPIELPHSAVVVSETVLLESLSYGFEPDAVASPELTIHTSRPLPSAVQEHRFGARHAIAAEVMLRDRNDASTCWIESVAEGWLFLIPNAAESTWVLGIGASLEALLDDSRLIGPRIEVGSRRSGEFPSSPMIVSPLCADGWLACGTAAIGFDPICGDGTAQAVREAVLASAVVRAISDGGDPPSLLAHYETRLIAGMMRHLVLCADFYHRGGDARWWLEESEALAEGQGWCKEKLVGVSEPLYQLRDFVLEPRRRVTG